MAIERDLSGLVLAGRYRVGAQIGGGGMGTVHAGEHLEVGRKVAIKILRPEAVSDPAAVERFRREARLTARVEHEHVVECLDVGVSDDGLCFYVMEWLRGQDVHALLRSERTLPWPRARSILAQVCRALAAAHAQGVVHRDLKPGNIFLVRREDNPDFVKVLDFGIAKLVAPDEAGAAPLTRIGEVVGTTPYMAPEMAAGEPFDHRVDVYAIGVILFQVLCGRLPYRGRTPRQILVAVLKGDLPRMSELNPTLVVSPGLEAVLQRALHRDPAQRYPDMASLHEALLDLPDDACGPLEDEVESPGPSASDSAMEASMLGPMPAGSREASGPVSSASVLGPANRASAREASGPVSLASVRGPASRVSAREASGPVSTASVLGPASKASAREASGPVSTASVLGPVSTATTASTLGPASDTGPASVLITINTGPASVLLPLRDDDTHDVTPTAAPTLDPPVPPVHRVGRGVMALAAVALILLVGGAWYFLRGPDAPSVVVAAAPTEVAPERVAGARATGAPEPVVEVQTEGRPGTSSGPAEVDVPQPNVKAGDEAGAEVGAEGPATGEAEPVAAEVHAGKKTEARSDFAEVMRRASGRARRCLAREGLKAGTRVRFDVTVEARTGRITGATPREPHQGQVSLGTCVVTAARGTMVRPAPMNEWRRSHELTL